MDQVEVSLPFYEYVLDFLAGGPSPQEIVKFRPSVEIQARFSELLAASRERELTLAEEEEVDHYIQIDRMFSLLKAKAYRKLDDPSL
jgi:hypothetical protein